jgi:hypothetical protein
MLDILYIVLALGGLAFVAFAALIGIGDHDGHDSGHFSLFSPLTLAILFASIGAYGLIARYGAGAGETASIVLAVGGGLITAYAVGHAAFRLIASSRGSSAIPAAAFAGATGEVTVGIPVGGVGEVVVMVGSLRHSGPARSADGKAIGTGKSVTVVRLAGSTFIVEPAG